MAIRLSGMVSGMDTESLVSAQMCIRDRINLAKNASMAPQTANYGKGAYEETGGMGSTSFDARQ